MKRIVWVLLLIAPLIANAQTSSWFVAIKTGLNIREKPEIGAKVIDKIPYATKITLHNDDEAISVIKTEGMRGFWRKVTYNNKTGYIIDSYLFSVAPPKATVKSLKDYILQLSVPFGTKLVVKSGSMENIEEGGWEMHKQLYKNGAEWHHYMGYEYGSDTYFLPGFTRQQAFLLLRMIPEFEQVFNSKDEYPTANKTIKKGEIEYSIRVETEMMTEEPWIRRISVEYADGAVYNFELSLMDNQIVIFLGSGV